MNTVVALLAVAGATFVLVAALGVVRLPDVLCRMHAATKAGAFGAALLLLAAVLHFQQLGVLVKAALTIAFFYFVAPIASHLLGRAAHRRHAERLSLVADESFEAKNSTEPHRGQSAAM